MGKPVLFDLASGVIHFQLFFCCTKQLIMLFIANWYFLLYYFNEVS